MAKTKTPRTIRVFIASPGDLAEERVAFKDTVAALNAGYGRGAKVNFLALGWEDALSQVGRRPQDLINKDIDACDVFVLAMFRRWGQAAPDAKARGFTSYTEEEFYRALKRFEKTNCPAIFAFFKHIDSGEMASPGPPLRKVLRFRKKLEVSKQVLWRGFKDVPAFIDEIDKHLRAFAEGELEPATDPIGEPLLPDSALTEMKKLRAQAEAAEKRAKEAEQRAKGAEKRVRAAEAHAEAKAATQALALAEGAATAALEGKIEEARQGFAKALDGTTNLRILYLGYEFFERIGDLDEAERLLRRWISISGPDREVIETAIAYGNLGTLEYSRGNADIAETLLTKALRINEKLDRRDGMAANYGNLGLVEFDRGNLDVSEAHQKMSLSISEEMDDQKTIAIACGNIGNIEFKRGRLERAKAQYTTALALNRVVGREYGMAVQYSNLGAIAEAEGDKVTAKECWTLSRDLYKKLGVQARQQILQGWLDRLS